MGRPVVPATGPGVLAPWTGDCRQNHPNTRGRGRYEMTEEERSSAGMSAPGNGSDGPESLQERVLASPTDYPDTWVEQAEFRERYDLPPFRPPRFTDGVLVHPVVEALEERHGVAITFLLRGSVDRNLHETGEWVVEVDGSPVSALGRSRDADSNTVIEVTSEGFRETIARHLAGEE